MDYINKQEVLLVRIDYDNIQFHYGEHEVIKSVSGCIPKGVNALIGPNGSGKTTLLRCIAGLLSYSGNIRFGQKNCRDFTQEEKEKLISYLPQFLSPHVALTVQEVILLGRMNSLKWRVGKKDMDIVQNMIEEMGLSDLKERFVPELSGGQRQLVFLAQAMVKFPRVLLLDEPTSSLDLQYQLGLFERLKHYVRRDNITVVVSLHDINMACRYADTITVLKEGTVITSGTPEETVTSGMISHVYNIQADIIRNTLNQHQIVPLQVIRA
jgi:iron complex transport system ATP-binding protein